MSRYLWLCGVAMLWVASAARADEVFVADGSRIVGEIRSVTSEHLKVMTQFAGELTLKTANVVGISSDRRLNVALGSGETVVGTPRYVPGEGQKIIGTSFGDLAVAEPKFTAVWPAGEADPRLATAQQTQTAAVAAIEQKHQEQTAAMNAQHAARVNELVEQVTKLDRPWKARLELGINGDTGNNERFATRGRIEAKRETEHERLLIYLQGEYAKENGRRTENEIFGGTRLEVDLSERWFVFGHLQLEKDEFENLDLRATATGGLGYFFIRKADHELKGRAGIGFEHESFENGEDERDIIAELGYDYRIDLDAWLRFTHSLTYYPSLGDPLEDYRLVAETAGEVPLSKEEPWKLRLGMRNEYDGDPQPGVDYLDTSYFLNLVYDWF